MNVLPVRSGAGTISVGFLTEGTFPYSGGGVSTWSNLMVNGLECVDFYILAVTSQPYRKLRYELPANVQDVSQVPLWGVSAIDALRTDTGAREIARQQRATTESAILERFIPPFRTFVSCLFQKVETVDWEACAGAVVNLAHYLRSHDYEKTFRSPTVWTTYAEIVSSAYQPGPAISMDRPGYTMHDISGTLSWLSALLRPLAIIPPQVDVYHATVASTVGLISVVERRTKGTPFLLTEHGVYLRERAINVSTNEQLTYFEKHFLIQLADLTARLCYHYADMIAPVCSFNGKWERYLGADPEKIQVIYNAIDTERFKPQPKPDEQPARPTVITVANIVPIKDIITLIRAAALVQERIPDVRFLIFGSVDADVDYVRQCQALIDTLDLNETVYLKGRHAYPEQVYALGDLTVLPSISEAFPFTILESMACGRPVVATDVGGVSEALGLAGVVVTPRSPAALADAIIELLMDPVRCQQLGKLGRERALQNFKISYLLQAYDAAYTKVISRQRDSRPLALS